MKFHRVRSGESSGSAAFSRCAGVRLSRNALAFLTIAAPVRWDAIMLPMTPDARTTAATVRRACFKDFILTSASLLAAGTEVVAWCGPTGGLRRASERGILNRFGESDQRRTRDLRQQALVAQDHLEAGAR